MEFVAGSSLSEHCTVVFDPTDPESEGAFEPDMDPFRSVSEVDLSIEP